MIETRNISCGYSEADVLQNLSLCLKPDSFSVLIGPNGAGKSTLLYAILGFVKLGSGAVWVCGKDIRSYHRIELARLISYVPQEVVFQFDYLVEDIVLMGRYPWLQMMQSWSNEDRQLVHGVLEQMELLELRNRYFSQLSGGEKQRVLIARALAQNTRFIFLDETLSQLDINHQIEIMKMLKTIRTDSGKGIVLISHNLNLAANHADKLIFMKSGRILAEGEPDLLLEPGLLAKMFNVELQTVRNPVSGRINIFYP